MTKKKTEAEQPMTAADLIQDEHNYRKHSETNKKRIRKSIEEAGLGRSVVVDAEGVIIAGNGVQSVVDPDTPVRVIETDGTELVVVKRTDLHEGDERRKKLALADNATSDDVEWDMEAVAEDWSKEEAEGWGVDWPSDEEAEQSEAQEDDFDDTVNKVDAVCKKGDIWKLGNHRLMCGDSTNAEDVARLMNGERADILLTDPPYGISVVDEDGKIGQANLVAQGIYMPVKGDETTDTARLNFDIIKGLSDKQIIFGGNYFLDFLPPSPSWIIWDKKGDMESNNFADGEMAWCSFHTPVRIFRQIWRGMIKEGENGKRVHPTQKPVNLLGHILRTFSKDGNIVLDCFGGSGSTLIACEQINRKCRMMEYEPNYCDVIIARWEKLTGNKAEKI